MLPIEDPFFFLWTATEIVWDSFERIILYSCIMSHMWVSDLNVFYLAIEIGKASCFMVHESIVMWKISNISRIISVEFGFLGLNRVSHLSLTNKLSWESSSYSWLSNLISNIASNLCFKTLLLDWDLSTVRMNEHSRLVHLLF